MHLPCWRRGASPNVSPSPHPAPNSISRAGGDADPQLRPCPLQSCFEQCQEALKACSSVSWAFRPPLHQWQGGGSRGPEGGRMRGCHWPGRPPTSQTQGVPRALKAGSRNSWSNSEEASPPALCPSCCTGPVPFTNGLFIFQNAGRHQSSPQMATHGHGTGRHECRLCRGAGCAACGSAPRAVRWAAGRAGGGGGRRCQSYKCLDVVTRVGGGWMASGPSDSSSVV